MKNALRIILWSLFGIIAAGYILLFAAYNGYKPGKIEQEVLPGALAYFNESYNECRDDFMREAANLKDVFTGVEVLKINIPSESGLDLYIDFAYIPAQDTSVNLVILTSGLHGIEGFAGSAVQMMAVQEIINTELLANTGLLLIHGLNPYGFIEMRKVSEGNVDLNRNCAIDPSLYDQKNDGYVALTDMLEPGQKADHANTRNRNFHLIAVKKIISEGMPALRQAALQGQYEYPGGIYYGGKKFEPQIDSIKQVLIERIVPYTRILTLDLHTGYGESGKLHLFPNPVEDEEIRKGMEDLFSGYQIDWGDSDDFYTILGSYADWVGSLVDGKTHFPMIFEYGTLDSQKALGSIRSIHNMILENQGYHHGYANDRAELKIKSRFREMYYPSSEQWRSKVIFDSKEILQKVFNKLTSMQ